MSNAVVKRIVFLSISIAPWLVSGGYYKFLVGLLISFFLSHSGPAVHSQPAYEQPDRPRNFTYRKRTGCRECGQEQATMNAPANPFACAHRDRLRGLMHSAHKIKIVTSIQAVIANPHAARRLPGVRACGTSRQSLVDLGMRLC